MSSQINYYFQYILFFLILKLLNKIIRCTAKTVHCVQVITWPIIYQAQMNLMRPLKGGHYPGATTHQPSIYIMHEVYAMAPSHGSSH